MAEDIKTNAMLYHILVADLYYVSTSESYMQP